MIRSVLGVVALSSVFALAACVTGMTEGDMGDVDADDDAALERPATPAAGHGKALLPTFQRLPHNEARKPGGEGGISYHGGPVMLGTVNIYAIWYGDWAGSSAVAILTDLLQNIGGTAFWNINTSYVDGAGTRLSNAAAFGGSATDSYSKGTALSDADVEGVVSAAISGGRLPLDASGVYLVLTSSDVTATSGLCTEYCGFHTHAAIGGKDIKYAFVGSPDRCPSSCAMQTTSPNGSSGADAMASIIAHELTESVTDPTLSAWYDAKGYENADKCAWTFGATYTVANGATANMKIGARDYLIQRNWVNASGGYCATGL